MALNWSIRALTAIVWLSGALFAANETAACAINRPPELRLAMGYQRDIIVGRAVVTVQSAAHIREPDGDAHPYDVTARITRRQSPFALPQTVRYERGWGSAACDLGFPKPETGDRWAVYFWRDNSGQVRVWEAFPLAVAIAVDPQPEWLQRR